MDQSLRRVASLDLLRGLAAYAVAVPHFLLYAAIGGLDVEAISVLAVEIFFVLSGYVLAPQILRCVAEGNGRNVWIFLVRRWMRTVPPYLVALLFISVMFNAVGSGEFVRYALYVQNFAALVPARDYYPVAWSLSIEEWFYVSFPVLLFGASRLLGIRSLRFMVVAALIYGAVFIMLRTVFGDAQHWGEQVRRVVVFRLDSIAYGFLLYVATEKLFPTFVRRAPGLALAAGLAVAATLAMVTGMAASSGSALGQTLFPFIAALFGASGILVAVKFDGVFERRAWLRATALFAGKMSYSIYLFHLIFVLLLRDKLATLPAGAQLLMYVALLSAFSAAFYLLFESPILAARPRLRSKAAAERRPEPKLLDEDEPEFALGGPPSLVPQLEALPSAEPAPR